MRCSLRLFIAYLFVQCFYLLSCFFVHLSMYVEIHDAGVVMSYKAVFMFLEMLIRVKGSNVSFKKVPKSSMMHLI